MNNNLNNVDAKKSLWLDKATDFFCKYKSQNSDEMPLQKEYDQLNKEWSQLWVEEAVVEELNKTHAVMHTDQFYILTEKVDPVFGGINFVLESKTSFKSFYENKLVTCSDGKKRTKAEIWLKSPNRREFKGITFDPTKEQPKNDLYNIWKGFFKKATKGNCTSYWNHVKDNICSKNPTTYQYVRKWLASVFQRPDKVHTALVLCGSQGVGKNSFVDPLGVLLGQHYAPLGNVSELISNFNFHLKNAVLIHANEAFWGGAKKEIGMLKAMITEETCLIEAKGKDRVLVKNYKHVIMSSNEDWPVSLDPDDRRFFVVNVADSHKEDLSYFKKIKEELENGGYEALLYDLLTEDLTDFDPRSFPLSEKAFDIKLRSATSPHNYIYEVLQEGCFSISGHEASIGWNTKISRDKVYKDYLAWCEFNGYKKEAHNKFTLALKKIIPSIGEARIRDKKSSLRTRVHILPDLEQAKREFCKFFKETDRIWIL